MDKKKFNPTFHNVICLYSSMNFKYMNWMCMQNIFFLYVMNESDTKYIAQGYMLNILLHYLEEIYYIKLFQV